MKLRKIFVVFLAIAATLSLYACGGTATQVEPTSAPTEEPSSPTAEATEAPVAEVVELTYFYRLTGAGGDSFNEWVISSFNEKFDGKIHVTGSSVDDETYKTKMAIELRSDNPPDVFFAWEGGRAKSVIDAGYAAVLDQYYDEFGWNDFLDPSGMSLATYDGKKYFVPYNMSGSYVWYRTDIYEELGLSVPTTWDELLANCEVIKASGRYCFVTGNIDRWPAQFDWGAILVNKYGVDVYQQLLDNEIPWTDSRVVDAFAEMKSLVDDGFYYPGINSMDYAESAIPFVKGEAVHEYMGTWFPSTVQGDAEEIPVSMGFFPYPQFGDVQPTTEVFAENTLMIHARSAHPEEAAEFVNYFISTEAQTKWTYESSPFPANLDVDLSQLSPLMKAAGEAMASTGGATYMHVDHAFDPAIADVFLNSLQAVIGGAMTPEEAAAATEAEAVKVRGEVQ